MTLAILAWLVAIPTLGAMTGLRSMAPMAVLCFFAYRGHLDLSGTWGAWAGNKITVIVFCVLALGELIGDKLPKTPDRTAIFPLVARFIFGGLVGALAATYLEGNLFEGAFLGGACAIGGAFLGFYLRQWLVHPERYSDFPVALTEDVLAVGLSILAMGIITG